MQFIISSRRGSLEFPLLTIMLTKDEDKSVAMVENQVIIAYRKNGDIYDYDTRWI